MKGLEIRESFGGVRVETFDEKGEVFEGVRGDTENDWH